jgi:hypothetical protein
MLSQELETSFLGHTTSADHIDQNGIPEWFSNITNMVIETYRSAIWDQLRSANLTYHPKRRAA